jgi:hypothetical protein
MANHEVKELLANARTLKLKSRIKTGLDEYMLIKVIGDVDLSTVKDPSLIGGFYTTTLKGRDRFYLIFGPTEKKRSYGGDHQRLIAHYGVSLGLRIRVFTLSSTTEVVLIIHSIIVKNIKPSATAKESLGSLITKSGEEYKVTKDALPIFALTAHKFLFSY